MNRTSSINLEELKKFNRSYEQWWDEKGEFKTLHDINPVRLKYITQKIQNHFNIDHPSSSGLTRGSMTMHEDKMDPPIKSEDDNTVPGDDEINHPLKNLNIIDIGCGGGLLSVPICKLGANVVGLDANENNIKAAADYAHKHNLNINFTCNTVEDYLSSEPPLYDVVLCMEVIEHVANPPEFLRNLIKLLKPNGLLILSTINRTMQSYFQAILMAEYVLRWVPAGTHDHAKFIKPSEIKNMLQGTSWKLHELKGLKLNLLDNSWYISEDIDVNYFACICGGENEKPALPKNS